MEFVVVWSTEICVRVSSNAGGRSGISCAAQGIAADRCEFVTENY